MQRLKPPQERRKLAREAVQESTGKISRSQTNKFVRYCKGALRLPFKIAQALLEESCELLSLA
jgi:hypothetical protein